MYSKEISYINNLYENIYSKNNNIPPHTFQISTGKAIESKLISYADLGDYLPFLILSGASRKYIENQILLTKNSFNKNPLIGSSVPHYLRKISQNRYLKKLVFNLGNEVAQAFSYSDFLFGLILINRIDNSFDTLDFALDTVKFIEETFSDSKGCLYYAKNISTGNLHKVIDSNNDFFAELYCELYDATKEIKFLNKSKDILKASLNSFIFTKYGVVPSVTEVDGSLSKFVYRKLMNKYILAKNNSSFAESLLAIYSRTRDESYLTHYYKWVNSVLSLRKKYSFTPFSWDILNDKTSTNLKNYAFIDCLINGFLITKDNFLLDEAEKVIKETLDWKDNKTGLIRDSKESEVCFFDSNTDFAVSLVSLLF